MLGELLSGSQKIAKALATRKIYMEFDRIPFRFDRVPLKKINNWIRTESSVSVRPERPWGLPTILQAEVTNLCNLRCALCPVTEGLRRPKGHMDVSLYKKLIDEVGDYVFLVMLWDWGEPLLNPAIYDMITYAGERGIKSVCSTNGHVLADAAHAEKLVGSGLDAIIFAVDGITQESYQQYRQGGDLGTALQGVKEVVAAKRALKSDTPLVNFRFLVTSDNQDQVPNLKEFVEPLGVDMLSLKTLNPHNLLISRSSDEFISEDCDYNRFDYDPVTKQPIRRKTNPCKGLWNSPTVHWDGMVAPCTYDAHDENVLGDLSRSSFEDIWHGEAYRSYRRRFRANYQDLSLCSECSYAFQGGGCGVERVPETYFFTRSSSS